MNKNDLNSRFINESFIRKIEDGMVKEAEVSVSSFIRDQLRENSFTDKIITPQDIGRDELHPSLTTDSPMVIVEKERGARASHIPFYGTPNTEIFEGGKYAIYFGKVTTPTYTKNINELMTYQNDLRKIISDNAAKEMEKTIDKTFIDSIDAYMDAAYPGGPVGFTVGANWVDIAGGFSKSGMVEALKLLPGLDKPKPNGCILMNAITAKNFLKFRADDVGDVLAGDFFHKGLTITEFNGVKILITIKRDIVPDDTLYLFPTEDFLGKYFVLQKPTVYIEHRRDIISFDTYMTLGLGIADFGSICKVNFVA